MSAGKLLKERANRSADARHGNFSRHRSQSTVGPPKRQTVAWLAQFLPFCLQP
jgi:hypothetical protein